MASYPSAVKAFTSKNDGAGNTVFAAHVNDLQDEVTAIEDGILNGTAPLHSSNTIVNNLSVAGGSTIAGNLTVTGSVVCSSLITAANQPRCQAYSTTTQAIGANSTAVLSLLAEDFDVGSLHSTSATPSRMTIPAGSSGLYVCWGQTLYNGTAGSISANDQIRLYLRKTGVDAVAMQYVVASTGANIQTLQVSGLLSLDAADYVELAAAAQANGWTAGSTFTVFASRLFIAKVA